MKFNESAFIKAMKEKFGNQKKFCEALGVSENTPINWRKRGEIPESRFKAVAKALDLSEAELKSTKPKVKIKRQIVMDEFFEILDNLKVEFQDDWTSNPSDSLIRATIREYNRIQKHIPERKVPL